MKPLFENVSPDLAAAIRAAGKKRSYGDGQLVFSEEEVAAYLPVVLSGSVKMLHYFDTGKEVIIGIFGQGEMFAVPPVFDGGKYPASTISMGDTELLLIERRSFLDLIRDSDEFAFAVIGWMCNMLREKTSTIQNLATASTDQRVATVLLKLASRESGDGEKRISLRRHEIAEMAGLTTETTIRVIRKFAAQDLLTIKRGKVIINSDGRLREHFRA